MQQKGNRGQWQKKKKKKLSKRKRDFPDGSVVKNPPANAGDTSSIPDLGKTHMLQSNQAHGGQLLSQCAGAQGPQLLSGSIAAAEAHTLRAGALQQKQFGAHGHGRGAPAHRGQRNPHQ